MAFLNGIFNKQQPAPAPAPVVPTPQPGATQAAGPVAKQLTAPANPGANPAVTAGAAPAAAPAGGPSELAAYADLFKPKPADPNAQRPATLADPILQPVDPTKFRESVQTANFAASIPQETLQKAMAGDAQAFMEAINHASREAFVAATTLSHGLSESASRTAAERALGSVDGKVRNMMIRTQNPTNEALSNPAVAPVFNAVKSQIATANPQLAPEAVHAAAEQYFNAMASELTAPQRQAELTKQQDAAKGTDFSFLLS